jgi:peptide/nickel transport system substrate-binding protein/oligopeptide transport system substrate-binding protein
VVAVLVVLAAGGLASCKRKGSGSGEGEGDVAPAFRAGVVRPSSLDPAMARTVDELLIADQLYDSLAAYDPKTLAPVPSLAAWKPSDDQLHWEFTLRSGARFTDGSKITAADVKATFDRVARKATGSSVVDLLELVTGYRAVAVDGTAPELAGVVVVSDTVVRIDLDAPWSSLPSALANPALGILPKSLIEAGGPFPAEPVSSGPFRVSAVSADRLTVAAAPGVTARTKRIEFVLFDDKAAAYDALVAGRVDWSEVPPDRLEEATKRFGRSLFEPYVAELFYAFNLRSPKFADIRVREAIIRAIDGSAILRDVYEGSVRPMDGLIVDGMAGRQDDPCAGRCDHDVERSKALIAELAAAGITMPEVVVDFEDDATQTAVATAIKDDLATVGVTATLRPRPLAEYQQFAVTGQQELFRLGWIAPYPSADAVLPALFGTGSPNNLTGFSNAAVDDALRAARAAASPEAQVTAYRAAEKGVLAELPIIPIGQFEIQSAANERVRGLDITSAGSFDGRRVWVVASSS